MLILGEVKKIKNRKGDGVVVINCPFILVGVYKNVKWDFILNKRKYFVGLLYLIWNNVITTRKKDIGEGHACDGPLRSITNVTYGDVP